MTINQKKTVLSEVDDISNGKSSTFIPFRHCNFIWLFSLHFLLPLSLSFLKYTRRGTVLRHFFDTPLHAVIYKTNINWTEWASQKETHKRITAMLYSSKYLLYIYSILPLCISNLRSCVAVVCCQSICAYFVMVASIHCKPNRMGQYTVSCFKTKKK